MCVSLFMKGITSRSTATMRFLIVMYELSHYNDNLRHFLHASVLPTSDREWYYDVSRLSCEICCWKIVSCLAKNILCWHVCQGWHDWVKVNYSNNIDSMFPGIHFRFFHVSIVYKPRTILKSMDKKKKNVRIQVNSSSHKMSKVTIGKISTLKNCLFQILWLMLIPSKALVRNSSYLP